MRRAMAVGWSGRPDGRCRIAELLMRGGRVAEAAPLWQAVLADTPDDVWLYNNAALEYTAIGDHDEALTWLTRGVQVAIATGDPEMVLPQLTLMRSESLTMLGRPVDDLQERAAAVLADPPPRPARTPLPAMRGTSAGSGGAPAIGFGNVVRARLKEAAGWAGVGSAASPAVASASSAIASPEPMVVALAWFPATDYQEALARWPELATEGAAKGGKDHSAYNRALQRTLQDYADAGAPRLFIAPIRIPAFLAWCREHDRDPADARAGYSAALARRGDPSLIGWPPGRNQPCWCGSGRKYKQCCGTVRP